MNLRDVTAALALIEQSLVVVGCARDHACPIAVYLTGRRDAMLAAMLQAPTDPTDPTTIEELQQQKAEIIPL